MDLLKNPYFVVVNVLFSVIVLAASAKLGFLVVR